jgi:hypothetical protein
MTTIRRGVFETNSSSEHSLTLFQDNIWKEFVERKVFILEEAFLRNEEHHQIFVNVIDDYSRDEFIINADEYYEQSIEKVQERPLKSSFFRDASYNNFTAEIEQFIKKNISREFLEKVLTSDSDTVLYTFDKPVKVNYGTYLSNNNDHIVEYNNITAENVYEILFNYNYYNLDKVYIYNSGTWAKKFIKQWTTEKNENRVLIEREVCD